MIKMVIGLRALVSAREVADEQDAGIGLLQALSSGQINRFVSRLTS